MIFEHYNQQYFFNWLSSVCMFEKVWNFIANKFTHKEQPRVVAAASHNRSHKISRLSPQSLPRQFYGLTLTSQQTSQKQEFNVEFKLIVDPSPKQSQKQQQENAQFSADIIDELEQLKRSMEKLSVSEQKLVEANNKTEELPTSELQKTRSIQASKKRHFELINQYKTQIKDFLELKYSKELADYPPITFEQFKEIHQYWKSKNRGHHQIKNTSFQCVQKLTFKAIGGLDYGQWLNDDIINIYIEMLQRRFIRDSNTQIRILNSYFATNTLTKTDTQIQRVLKKKNLDKNHMLIMPVNNKNHWYFAVFQDQQLVVYDSIRHAESYYLQNPIFKNALKFAKMFYDKQFQLRVRSDYPQQDNYYDCGVFMLMGIRDTLRAKQWSFHQGDIRFKRIQISHEILREILLFTE